MGDSTVPDIGNELIAGHVPCDDQIVPEYTVPNSKDKNVQFSPSSEDLEEMVVPDLNAMRKARCKTIPYNFTEKAWVQMHYTLLYPLQLSEKYTAPLENRNATVVENGRISRLYKVTSRMVSEWKHKPRKWWQRGGRFAQPAAPATVTTSTSLPISMMKTTVAPAMTVTNTNSTSTTVESNADYSTNSPTDSPSNTITQPNKKVSRHLARSITHAPIGFYNRISAKLHSKGSKNAAALQQKAANENHHATLVKDTPVHVNSNVALAST
ncbi:hypothetical protein BDF19DRAFT_278026 [Syncephalis fuscata]|nr:hypothetical protein BDF19DRAFT_278026 [Syncephalis fuscata]